MTFLSVENAFLSKGKPAILLKIQKKSYEVNIWFSIDEIPILQEVESISWKDGSVKIGTSANSDVSWSSDGNEVSIFIGHDDETWDIAVYIKKKELKELIAEIEKIT